MLSQLEYVCPAVLRNLRIDPTTVWEIPRTEAMKKAKEIRQFASHHPVVTAIILIFLCVIFFPLVMFLAFVMTCLLVGLAIFLALFTGFVFVAATSILPFVLPVLALTVGVTASVYAGIRVTVAAGRWFRGQIERALQVPSWMYHKLHHKVSEFFLSNTGDLFIHAITNHHLEKSDKPHEESGLTDASEAEGADKGTYHWFMDVHKYWTKKGSKKGPRNSPKRPKSPVADSSRYGSIGLGGPDGSTGKGQQQLGSDSDEENHPEGRFVGLRESQARQGASGTTFTGNATRGRNYGPQKDITVLKYQSRPKLRTGLDSGDSDGECFTEASEWLTEDEFGNIIPDYRDKDMKLYDALVRRGFKAYEPFPY